MRLLILAPFIAVLPLSAQAPPQGAQSSISHRIEASERVLESDPNNKTALLSIASLTFQSAQSISDPDQKRSRLDEAFRWYEKVLRVDPINKEAFYSLAVIDWAEWYSADMVARGRAGMRLDEPGPIADAGIRQRLALQYGEKIEDGIANLQKALAIDPQYSDAMAYMNLLIRERADIRESAAEANMDTATADNWIQKALTARRQTGVQVASGFAAAPPPPPPPQPPPPASNVQRIRVGGNVQAANLIHRVDPEYPQLARQARIQGVVRFSVVISKEGHVENAQLVQGHPLLVQSGLEAVNQYQYKPTLLNGQPVEVLTVVDVNFSLPQISN